MSTQLELKDDECAIVLKGDGSCECIVPLPTDPNAIVSDNTILAAAVATAVKNKDSHITAIVGNFMKEMDDVGRMTIN